jgi:hypothetical protein
MKQKKEKGLAPPWVLGQTKKLNINMYENIYVHTPLHILVFCLFQITYAKFFFLSNVW